MATYRVEMSFNWKTPPTFFQVTEPVQSKFLPRYQEIAAAVGAKISDGFYPLQNGLVRLVGTTGTPHWFTALVSGGTLSFYFFDNTRDQRSFKLALPILSFAASTSGQPQQGEMVYPLPPISANHITEEQFENPWMPRLNKPSQLHPSLYASTYMSSYVQRSQLPSWWVVGPQGETIFDLVRTGIYQMSVTVGVLGPDDEGTPDKVMRIYGFDPEMVVGSGSSEGAN